MGEAGQGSTKKKRSYLISQYAATDLLFSITIT